MGRQGREAKQKCLFAALEEGCDPQFGAGNLPDSREQGRGMGGIKTQIAPCPHEQLQALGEQPFPSHSGLSLPTVLQGMG